MDQWLACDRCGSESRATGEGTLTSKHHVRNNGKTALCSELARKQIVVPQKAKQEEEADDDSGDHVYVAACP